MGSVARIKIEGKIWRYVALCVGMLLCAMCLGAVGMTVHAQEQSFEIDAQMLPSDKESLDILLTIENLGADWEGTVRLTADGIYSCAYDTVLSLPQGSTKQFVVRIPGESVENTDGTVAISLLDRKSKLAAKKEFRRLLQGGMTSISMGILSDEYTMLTYMDMGGNEYYYNGGSYPIKLVELNQDNLTQMLSALTFLVIDSYNTGVLSDAAVGSIEDWVENGGMLLVGTGSNAEDTLRALEFLEVQCDKVWDTGEEANKTSSDYYYMDVSQLSWAELIDAGYLYEDASYSSAVMVASRGTGAVGILPYALSEMGRMDMFESGEQEYIVSCMLDEVGEQASSRYAMSGYSMSNKYSFRRMLRFLGMGSENLSFGVLRVIVILYVIFVGPVLYLLLRLAKKRDLYWAAVPISALAVIILVYFAGRGFEVVDAKVYSVTIQNLSKGEHAKTYLHCYDNGNKEWSLRLADRYEYVGPVENSYSYGDDADHYIRKEGDRLFFGINPSASFEDCYFMAGGSSEAVSGSISNTITQLGSSAKGNTVTNGTSFDFAYFAVVSDNVLFVYKNFPAGQTCDLSSAELVYTNTKSTSHYDVINSYMYGCLSEMNSKRSKEDMDALTALGVGIAAAHTQENQDSVIIIGVVKDWDKAVDDSCGETSYGCFYTIQ